MIRTVNFQDCISTEICRDGATVIKVTTPKGAKLAAVHPSPGVARALVCELLTDAGELIDVPDENAKAV